MSVHDPGAKMLAGIERSATDLGELFGGVAVAGTTATAPAVLSALETIGPIVVDLHEPGEDQIGAARRQSVGMAVEAGAGTVLYSDLDHVLRWVETDQAELEACLDVQPAVGLLVVGRSESAFAASPARLRETERLVNHVYELMTGRSWDLMFAIRRLSAPAAADIVRHCREDTIANDVVWPFLAERLGHWIGYFAASGLSYLVTADFDQEADHRDDEPGRWIERLRIAAGHASVMADFLEPDG